MGCAIIAAPDRILYDLRERWLAGTHMVFIPDGIPNQPTAHRT
jgi:hypothetical protein